MPGVESASLAGTVPLGYYSNSDQVLLTGRQKTPADAISTATYNVVTSGYFRTMRVRLLRGRIFTEADNEKAQYTAIISEGMAKEFWPGQDPIGREFRIGSEPAHSLRIVGVVGDIRFEDLSGKIRPYFYLPLWQHYATNSLTTLQIRTSQNEEAAIPEVGKIIQSVAPNLPVFDVKTMRQALYTINGLLMFEVGAGVAGALGLIGLVLAVVGVYGVVSYVAAQRTHEIGLRMALGAKPSNIMQMVFSHGFLTIGLGLAAGLAVTLAAAQVIGRFVIVSPTDPVTYIGVILVLTFVALSACYLPARRAMRTDPMSALRQD